MGLFFTLLGARRPDRAQCHAARTDAEAGRVGRHIVRFLFGFPFAFCFLPSCWRGRTPITTMNRDFALWTLMGAATQIGGTALMLMTMEATLLRCHKSPI